VNFYIFIYSVLSHYYSKVVEIFSVNGRKYLSKVLTIIGESFISVLLMFIDAISLLLSFVVAL
jgi:hypothetical protein